MSIAEKASVQTRIDEEIRRAVADAVADHRILPASECAARILRTHGPCRMTKPQLADRLTMAAASAGVAVEIGADA